MSTPNTVQLTIKDDESMESLHLEAKVEGYDEECEIPATPALIFTQFLAAHGDELTQRAFAWHMDQQSSTDPETNTTIKQ